MTLKEATDWERRLTVRPGVAVAMLVGGGDDMVALAA
jgi:hypothetical protein